MTVKHKALTQQIIGAFYTVYNSLGYGFLEKVYENALAIELQALSLKVEQQASISVYYTSTLLNTGSGQLVGEYFADLLINDAVIPSTGSGQASNSKPPAPSPLNTKPNC